MSMTDVTKELASRWKSLSAEDKAPYEAEAKADKERSATYLITWHMIILNHPSESPSA
jgi:hypothetical protein